MWPRGSRSAQQPAQQQVHILDRLFRAVVFNNFFRHGLGPADDLERLLGLKRTMAASLQRDTVLVDSHVRNGVSIDRRVQRGSGHVVYEGHFTSPLSVVEPSLLQPNEQVRFQLVLPSSAPVPSFVTGDVKAAEQQQQPPVMLHLASTGDHGFWRRRLLHAIPLAQRHQVGSLILETPLYGARRPKAQLRSNLRYVSDLYTMGLANIFEAVPMMHWLAHHGMGTLGVGGFSVRHHNEERTLNEANMINRWEATWPPSWRRCGPGRSDWSRSSVHRPRRACFATASSATASTGRPSATTSCSATTAHLATLPTALKWCVYPFCPGN